MRGAPSFRGFLSSLAARLKLVRYASKLKDKLGFLLWVVLSLQPKTIASRLPQGLRGKRRALLSALFFKLTFKVDGVDYAPLSFDNLGLILPESESWMWRFLKPRKGNVVLDVGAHVGKYALRLSREVGEEGLVIALEPHPETFKALARGAALSPFKNIVPLDVAAWNEERRLPLFVGGMAGTHSLKRDFGLGRVEVQAKPLDKILKELGVNRVDWVKIDVEGAELEALEGMGNALKQYHPKIVIEVGKGNVERVKRFLKRYGYSMAAIKGTSYFYCV